MFTHVHLFDTSNQSPEWEQVSRHVTKYGSQSQTYYSTKNFEENSVRGHIISRNLHKL